MNPPTTLSEDAVKNFLWSKGFEGTAKIFEEEKAFLGHPSNAERSKAMVHNQIKVFSLLDTSPKAYAESFATLKQWIENAQILRVI